VSALAKKDKTLERILVMIYVIVLAGMITAGVFYYSNYKAQYKSEIGKQLTAIGKLKVDEISNWRKERLGDGKIFYKNDVLSALVKRYFNDPNDAEAREQIKQRLNDIQPSCQYDRLMLLDSLYRKKMIIPDSPEERSTSYVSWDTSDILGTGQIVFEDFYWNEQNHKIYLKILVPIFEEGSSKMIGAVALRIDPETYLYPFIANWPVPNIKTAETLLVRKKGESVEYLNELKFRKGTALKLEHSVANIDLPAVKAVLGHEGVVDGIDYQGKPVLADVRAIPDSPWFLVTKINVSEVYAPLYKKLWTVIAFVTILIGGAGAGFGAVWRQQRVRFYRQKYDEAKEWSATFDSIPDLVSIIGCDYRLKIVNKNFADVFGKRKEDLIGKRCCEIVHNTKEPPENCPLRKTLADGKAAKVELYYEALRKHLEVSTYPVFGDNGEIIEVVHFIRDITERKLMEEGRRKANAELRDALRFNQEVILNAAVGVVVYDTQLRYLEWNTFMENMTGMKKKDVIGKDATKLFPHIHESGVDKVLERVLGGETISMPDVAYRCLETGKKGWVASTYTPHRNSAGQIIGAIGMIRDITARKEAEGNLKNSETMFRSIATAVPVGLGMAADRQIQWVNDYLLQLLGRQREEVVGTDSRIFYENDEGYNLVGNQFYKELEEKGSSEIAVNWKHKDGRILNILLTGVALDKENVSEGIIFAALDITERKQAERRLLAVNTLQENLLLSNPIEQKLKLITDTVVNIMDADFSRIWVIKPGDKCETGCVHAETTEGLHVCRFQDKCLHLVSSSGRYTHIDGKGHCRVPFGCYKIGLIASGDEEKFLTNEAMTDPRVHNNAWAKELGLVSFAGYRLSRSDGTVLGVLALFNKHPILPEGDAIMEGIAHLTSMVLSGSQTDEELHKSEEQFRLLSEAAFEPIIIHDKGVLISVNDQFCEMTGYERDELIGENIISMAIAPEAREFMMQQIASGNMETYESIGIRKDGTRFPIEIRVRNMEYKGRMVRVGSVRDITERKKMEEELHKTAIIN
jgi:PAS domain S-box-containing protein